MKDIQHDCQPIGLYINRIGPTKKMFIKRSAGSATDK